MKESGVLLPVPSELIRSRHFVYDLVYTPLETVLVKRARDVGARAVNGLGMLLYQAALAFDIWTGTSAPIEIMHKVLTHELESGDWISNAKKRDQQVPP